jgi:molybdopterin molybdotransferase
MRARVEPGEGGWECTPFDRQDSSLLSVLAEANALMLRPPHDPALKAHHKIEFLWL